MANNNKVALKRYRVQRSKSCTRNIEFNLTFDEWYAWWLSNGIDKQTHESDARSGSALCMCRFNDTGPYSLTNIYCATRQENSRDARRTDPRTGNIKNRRAIKTPLGVFDSADQAARAHNCTTATIRNRLRSGKYPQPGYDYVDLSYKQTQSVCTPMGTFDSLREAAAAMNIHITTVRRRCQQVPQEYYYV